MRRPSLGNGFNSIDEQTLDGNILAHRGFRLLWFCDAYHVSGLPETPNSSR